uniref:NADP-dependent oxidoreductase domain-containing protein n=1 Tax=Aureoumbra lagunensis TaxID=44058 RepID=A0A7S3JYP2_9STRA
MRHWKKQIRSRYLGLRGRPFALIISGCCLTTSCVFGLKFMGGQESVSLLNTSSNNPVLRSNDRKNVWPPLMYGTAWKKEKTKELVVTAIKEGFEGIDVANQPKHYREDLVGDALHELEQNFHISRSSLWIQTKFTPIAGQDRSKPMPYKADSKLEDQVDESIQSSLRNLGKIDCLVLHSPLRTIKDTIRVWRRFEAAVDRGEIIQLGISNCYSLDILSALYDAAKHKPKVLQNRFYRDSNYDQDLRSFCSQHDIIYQTFWTLTANGDKLRADPIRQAATRLEATPPQILFAWLIKQGHQPLTGTTDLTHMRQDLKAPDLAEHLTPEEESSISSLFITTSHHHP